jgi:sodium/pantothenate symporter
MLKDDVMTLEDVIRSKYNNKIALSVALINLIRFFSILLIQTIAGAKLLSTVTGFSYLICVAIMIFTMNIYLYSRGYEGVLKSDIVQVILLYVPLLVSVPYLFSTLKNLPVTHFNIFNAGILYIRCFLHIWICISCSFCRHLAKDSIS